MIIEISTSADGKPSLAVHDSKDTFLKSVELSGRSLEKVKYEMPVPGDCYYDLTSNEYKFLIEGDFLSPTPKLTVVEWTLEGKKV